MKTVDGSMSHRWVALIAQFCREIEFLTNRTAGVLAMNFLTLCRPPPAFLSHERRRRSAPCLPELQQWTRGNCAGCLFLRWRMCICPSQRPESSRCRHAPLDHTSKRQLFTWRCLNGSRPQEYTAGDPDRSHPFLTHFPSRHRIGHRPKSLIHCSVSDWFLFFS